MRARRALGDTQPRLGEQPHEQPATRPASPPISRASSSVVRARAPPHRPRSVVSAGRVMRTPLAGFVGMMPSSCAVASSARTGATARRTVFGAPTLGRRWWRRSGARRAAYTSAKSHRPEKRDGVTLDRAAIVGSGRVAQAAACPPRHTCRASRRRRRGTSRPPGQRPGRAAPIGAQCGLQVAPASANVRAERAVRLAVPIPVARPW